MIASDIPGHRVLARLGPAVRLSVASPQSLATDMWGLPPAGGASLARTGVWLIPNFSVDRCARDTMRHYDAIAAAP